MIAGKVVHNTDAVVKGGAKITQIFEHYFAKEIEKIPKVTGMKIEEVRHMIKNHSGITVPIYVPHQAFESIVRRHIELLRGPALKNHHIGF